MHVCTNGHIIYMFCFEFTEGLANQLMNIHQQCCFISCWFYCPLRLDFCWFIYLFGVLRHFQHCTGHITTSSWKGRGNQYIYLFMVLYGKLLTNCKQLSAFALVAVPGIEPQPQRWESRVLPLCHHGPLDFCWNICIISSLFIYLGFYFTYVPVPPKD